MPKRFLYLLLILILPAFGFSQSQVLEIQGKGNTLYLEHHVAPKESFYSIGRLYNVSPRDLAAYNHLSLDNGLAIGQVLKVPLDKNNFAQNTSKSAAEALVPLYHTVLPNETLFRIGVNYQNVPLSSLKKWNTMSSDNVVEGNQMIVGYLRVNKSESALATSEKSVIIAKNTPAPQPEKPVENVAPEKTVDPEKVEETAPSKPMVVKSSPSSNKSISEGFFKKEYEQLASTSTEAMTNGTASIFKSTSGWQDGKYYCFNNDVAPGSVIKVTDNQSGKTIYAKVLDAIPEIKQNEGLTLVLSNSAADALGVSDSPFPCVINFVK